MPTLKRKQNKVKTVKPLSLKRQMDFEVRKGIILSWIPAPKTRARGEPETQTILLNP